MISPKYKFYYKNHRTLLVHRGTILEGLFTTEYQTAEIIEQGEAFGVSTFALLVTQNILNAWNYIFTTKAKSDYRVLLGLHKKVSQKLLEPPFYSSDRSEYVGTLRDFPVRVRTSERVHEPPMPKESRVRSSIDNKTYTSPRDVLRTYLWLCKGQFFGDGNKRTAYLFANYLLAKNDLGYFFLVPDIVHYYEYMKKMTNYYVGTLSENHLLNYLTQFLVVV